jgi:hypothetical protein
LENNRGTPQCRPLASIRKDDLMTSPVRTAPTVSKSSVRTRLRTAARALRARLRDQRGSQITDNLGLIVIGIVAVVAIGGLISGLDSTVFNWVTKQLGVG